MHQPVLVVLHGKVHADTLRRDLGKPRREGPVGRVGNLIRLIQDLKEAGLWVYGVDPQAEKLHTDIDMTGSIALVLGGEGEGIRPGVLGECDDRIRIPMQGRVQSLNVSAAAAVMLFEVVRQRRKGVVPTTKATES